MDTILKHSFLSKLKIRDSISFRTVLLSLATAIAIILLCNILFFNNLSETITKIKNDELLSAASEYSASLSAYGLSHAPESAEYGSTIHRRIIVTDMSMNIIHDSSEFENLKGKTFFHPSAVHALDGGEFFSIKHNGETIDSCVSKPVFLNKKIIGSVCIFESDTGIPLIVKSSIISLILISIITLLLIMICALLVSGVLLKRIHSFVVAIRKTKDKTEPENIDIRYRDEIAPIISEFNDIHERLAYVNQMRQAFVSDASHELRTPLAAIKLLCESITQTSNVDPETVIEFMDDIILEVDRMSHTAEKLLVLSRLDNSARTNLAPIPLSDIVHNIITTLMPIADAKNVTIESHLEEACTILGDMEGVNQIISNLIDNAIKYNNVGGTLRIYLYTNHGKCTFITDDTGIGIAPEERENIFKRFYRVDKSRKHDGRGGSGLGLAIVKRNIESFDGTITVTDSVHGGTRFTVTFPSLSFDEEVDI